MNRNPELQIVLNIKNNTNLTQPVEIFSAISNNNVANNSNAIYTWDLSTENYLSSNQVAILISNTSNPTPAYYSVDLTGNNIQSVVDALNTLNQGLFQYDGTTIYVSNNYYIYGALQVLSPLFNSTWNTNNISGGSSASNQIQLPLDSFGTYNFLVDWGDGSQDTITTWNQAETLHTYAIAGTYNLSINGVIEGFVFNFTGDREKLLSISSWGTLKLINTYNFGGCSNLNLSSVSGILDLVGTFNLDGTFASCTSLTTINFINYWDTSSVVSMVETFRQSSFNDNINSWNTSSVLSMNGTFANCTSFNQPLNNWNVSSVTNFIGTFSFCSAFNQPLNNWNVTNATLMNSMFQRATNFNQPLNSWNTNNVGDMSNMFRLASNFNQDISSWNVSNVTSFDDMFRNATSFNQTIGSWNVISAQNMARMFQFAINFNQDISLWNVSNVVDFNNMFRNATAFNQPIGSWNVISAQNMSQMFQSATNFNQNIGSWNILNVSNFTSFMTNKTNLNYSATNLDAIYNGWSLLIVVPNLLAVSFGTIKYTLSGQAGRNILTGAPNNWAITDGGI